jgi:hypothetical protein
LLRAAWQAGEHSFGQCSLIIFIILAVVIILFLLVTCCMAGRRT